MLLPAGREGEVSRRVLSGLETAPENWQHAQNRLADWLQTLPPQTGIIAVTDARARHVLRPASCCIFRCRKLCVIGIDNEELTRYLSRVALLRRPGHPPDGYQAEMLHRLLLDNEPCRCSASWFRRCASLSDAPPTTAPKRPGDSGDALHSQHACKGIKVEQVLDAVGISRSNLEKRFKEEVGKPSMR
jgi:LacI family transcriptional regulator